MTIRSKVHEGGDPKESSWPPRFGTNQGKGGLFYRCKETGKIKEGYPPNPNPKQGEAPMVIFDSMDAQYHEGVGRKIESRKEWERADNEAGTITVSNLEKESAGLQKKRLRTKEYLSKDRKNAAVKAISAYKADPKGVSRSVKEKAVEQIKTLEESGLSKQLESQGVKIHD